MKAFHVKERVLVICMVVFVCKRLIGQCRIVVGLDMRRCTDKAGRWMMKTGVVDFQPRYIQHTPGELLSVPAGIRCGEQRSKRGLSMMQGSALARLNVDGRRVENRHWSKISLDPAAQGQTSVLLAGPGTTQSSQNSHQPRYVAVV